MTFETPSSAMVWGSAAGEPGRVVERADADDDALAGHESGNRLLGADRARGW